MNCIIEGDNVTCKLLEEFVGKSSFLNLVGTYNDSASAWNQLSKRQDIDLIFLDIEMPEIDISKFIRNIDNKPNFIIISSGDQNAQKTFDLNVVDFLLKPVTYSGFCKAVDKAFKYYSRKEVSKRDDDEILIKKGSSLVRLKFRDITYIEALENNVILNTNDKRFTIHFTLNAIENQLPSEFFIRIHQSCIVNKRMIKAIKENTLDLIVGDTVKNLPVDSSFRDLLLNDTDITPR
jgi:DNA-binding LytR/AlgR family response regulator